VSEDLISKASRNEFRETLTGYTLREIEMIFDAGGLAPRSDNDPQIGGQRRSLVECFYANIDFTSVSAVKSLPTVYEKIIHKLRTIAERNADTDNVTLNSLVRRMETDGFRYKNGRFLADSLDSVLASVPSLVRLTDDSTKEHLQKTSIKIANGDSAGAITNGHGRLRGASRYRRMIAPGRSTPSRPSG
jgi:hypothetical protein